MSHKDLGDTMSEATNSSDTSESVSESSSSEPVSAAPKNKRKLWVMVAAVVVVAILLSTVLYMFVLSGLSVKVNNASLESEAGAKNSLSVTVKWGTSTVSDKATILWSTSSPDLGSFDLRAKSSTTFTAGIVGMTGNIVVKVDYKGQSKEITIPVTVKPPFLDSVIVAPSAKTVAPGSNQPFSAVAISSVGLPLTGATFAWTYTGNASDKCTLNTTSGANVSLSIAGDAVTGGVLLNATATLNSIQKSGNASVMIGGIPPRNVSYRWYDMFNVPFGEWWDKRNGTAADHEVWTRSYPYIWRWHGSPAGNLYYYTNMRLNITGRNMPEVNMASHPEFLPYLGTSRGGTAVIAWNGQYLTSAQCEQRGATIASWNDGWIFRWWGNVTMDQQAAAAVIGLTQDGFNNFAQWWTDNKASVTSQYSAWIDNEGNRRLDIYANYGSTMQTLDFRMDAHKVGDKIVLYLDTVSWGMELLLSRWIAEAWFNLEWYMEDFHMNATIGPERMNLDITTVAVYASYAYETTLVPEGQTNGEPCWVWEALMQDYVHSTATHRKSLYDKYSVFEYINFAPGSDWYNQSMTFDYVPKAFNLTYNETLSFEWPQGEQMFYYNIGPDQVGVIWDRMVINYSEPMPSDTPDPNGFLKGSITIDNTANKMVFKGPMDMYDWSRNQTAHQSLYDQWRKQTPHEQMGIGPDTDFAKSLIPYGAPYVEFKPWTYTPIARVLGGFDIAASQNPTSANTPVSLTVKAMDQYGVDTLTSFRGTVHFTTNATGVYTLPADYTFTSADAGVHVFSGVEFGDTGIFNVTVENGTKTGVLLVNVLPVQSFTLSLDVNPIVVNTSASLTVTAKDYYGATYAGYRGTVHFETNATVGNYTLPADYLFTAGDAGVHVFAGVGFNLTGKYNVTVSDVALPTKRATLSNINVVTSPPVLDHLEIQVPDTLTGTVVSATVTALDQYGIVFPTYTGTVNFTTNATAGTYILPPDATFILADAGVKVISGIKFNAAGNFSVSVTDTVSPSVTGTCDVEVSARGPKTVMTIYDMFEQHWREWWVWRYNPYTTDLILWNETHKYTCLYNPDKQGMQGIIYAPYRWNVTAENMTTVTASHPEFMPTPTTTVPGSEVKLKIHFDYLNWTYWSGYWLPTWSSNPNWTSGSLWNHQMIDGYDLGVIYRVEMNREAAESWLGMPQAADALTWWGTHGWEYRNAWLAWIMNEGNVRLDIYSGYEFPYTDEGTTMSLEELPTGNLVLNIGHLNWGFEVLICRWTTELGLPQHETYMEDFTLGAEITDTWSTVKYDGVCQYSLKNVRANQSSTGSAWVWEPARIDYIASNTAGYHPSQYDPWAPLLYTSWNTGDPLYGTTSAAYDVTPGWMNLTSYETLIIKVPQGDDVLAYHPGAVDPMAILNIPWYGDYSAYNSIMFNGSMQLGYSITNPASPWDLASGWDNTTKTLTIHGPLTSDQFHFGGGATGPIYHGTPWIEFNVTPVGGGAKTLSTPASVSAPETTVSAASVSDLAAIAVLVGGMMAVVASRGFGIRREEED